MADNWLVWNIAVVGVLINNWSMARMGVVVLQVDEMVLCNVDSSIFG